MRIQTALEERWNAITHGLGALLGVVGLILLIISDNNTTPYSLFSVIVYGLSLIVLFTASTVYHAVRNEKQRHVFRIIDHISIYFLIAGTYTPVVLIALAYSLGFTLFWVVWGIAAMGLVLKLFFTGKFELLSTLLYLVMGWLIVFDYSNLSKAIGDEGILLLFAGGMAYTVGIVFYLIDRIPYNHIIWHLFVLLGAICHFFMIFFFVI